MKYWDPRWNWEYIKKWEYNLKVEMHHEFLRPLICDITIFWGKIYQIGRHHNLVKRLNSQLC